MALPIEETTNLGVRLLISKIIDAKFSSHTDAQVLIAGIIYLDLNLGGLSYQVCPFLLKRVQKVNLLILIILENGAFATKSFEQTKK